MSRQAPIAIELGLSLGRCAHVIHARFTAYVFLLLTARPGSARDRHFVGAGCGVAGRTGAGSWNPAVVLSKPGLLIRRLGERQHREAAGTWHRKYGKDRLCRSAGYADGNIRPA